MRIIRNPNLLFTFVILVCLCLTPVRVLAGSTTIPWMTGYFPGENTFALSPGVFSPDGQWFFNIWTTLVEGPTQGSMECGNGFCQFNGFAPITAGTAGGEIDQWNGTNYSTYATFTGWVTGGGVDKTEVYQYDTLIQFNYQYHYGFVGTWSNQWHTSGSVYGWNVWYGNGDPGPGGSWFDITTQTPEPGTIMLLGTGLLGLARVLSKK